MEYRQEICAKPPMPSFTDRALPKGETEVSVERAVAPNAPFMTKTFAASVIVAYAVAPVA